MTASPQTTDTLDVAALRRHFPQLADRTAYFDGPGGTQTPDVVADAIRDALLAPMANRGTATQAARNADDITRAGRAAVGDLLGVPASTVVFGRSATELTFQLARTLSRGWGPGDEVVVTRLDHDANIRPWVQSAERVGATVRWAELDPATGELAADAVAAVMSSRTRLVAVTAASNLIGTRPDVAAIGRLAHNAGAVLYVDGVHYAAHASADVGAIGADLFACSPYKFLGPHCGVVAGRPELLASLRPDKLLPATAEVPERFELGTLPYELLAGTTAAVDFLAAIGPGGGETRRGDLVAAFAAIEEHEDALRLRLEAGLHDLGATLYSRAAQRTPTLLFTFDGRDSTELYRFLAARGVDAPAGSFYAIEASRALGLGDDGAVRVGLAPYTNDDDVDRLLDGLRAFVA